MSDIEAYRKWKNISPEHQRMFLNNVFCLKCQVTTITNYTIENDRFGIVIKGKCKNCGADVARAVDI